MIPFPVTVESFTDYQKQLVGRELDRTEEELIEALVDVFNYAHTAGLRQDSDTLDGVLQALDGCQAAEAEFCNACRHWVVYAWESGKEASQYGFQRDPQEP